jgi:hypothetical protein
VSGSRRLRLLAGILLPVILVALLASSAEGRGHGGGHGGGTTTTTTSATTTTVAPTTTTTAGTSPSGPIALGFASFQPTTEFTSYQTAVGSLPNFYEWYQSWTSSNGSLLYYASQEALVHGDGLTPIISWSTDALPLANITAGKYDAATLAPAVTAAKAWPGTLYIRLDWEMNGSWSEWYSSGPAFIAMWRHVVTYFRNAGVTNVRWVWAPNIGTNLAAYYPGDSYVDDVGLDGYNQAQAAGVPWETPQQVFGSSYAELEGITKKPVIITETSSVEANSAEAAAGESKAQWISQLAAYLPTLGNVIGVCWFNQESLTNGAEVDWSVDTSAATLAAWDADFVSNPEYAGALP